jgi:hypothetical protein
VKRLGTWLWNWSVDYCGFGAEFVKAIPVLIQVAIIGYPLWSLPIFLGVSQGLPRILQYGVYGLWVGQWCVIAVLGYAMDFSMHHRK